MGPGGEGGQEARWHDGLVAGLDRLGLTMNADVQQRLVDYLALLQRWNRTYNLTALRDPGAMLTQHLMDCLAILPALRQRLPSGSLKWLDVGSGGGLPGVVLAIVEPSWSVACVDTVGKKAAFIRQVASELALPNLQGVHARVESLSGRYDVVISRAFASLPLFVELTAHLVADKGCWAAMKGKVPDDEIQALPASVEVFHVEHLQVPGLDAERCIVWMRPRR